MKEIICKKCFSKFETTSNYCPNCGTKYKKEYPKVLIVFIIIALSLFVLNLFKSNDDNSSEPDFRSEALLMAEHFILERIKTPSTAEFESHYDAKYWTLQQDNELYHFVESYVDAQNLFGAKVRTHFEVKMRRSGNDWFLVGLKTW